jgi:hypothetical protein
MCRLKRVTLSFKREEAAVLSTIRAVAEEHPPRRSRHLSINL